MAQYPIKMLKDESGKPFVPLTQINAVVGDKYIVSSFEALQASTGHFIITHNHLTDEDILNKVIAVIFPEDITATTNSYLRLNDGADFLIYDEDGSSPLLIKDFSNVVCFLVRRLESWQLVKTGAAAAASGSGGHTILDGAGNVLPQQGVLQFKGFGVSDSPGTGATVISTPALVNNLTTASSGTGPLDAYQGKVLNDKLESSLKNYLPLAGGSISGHLRLTGVNTTSGLASTSKIIFSDGTTDYTNIYSSQSGLYIGNSLTEGTYNMGYDGNANAWRPASANTTASLGTEGVRWAMMHINQIKLKGSQYMVDSTYGIDVNNSDIVNINGLYLGDAANSTSEGLLFYRDGTNWDTFRVYDGVPYLNINHAGSEKGTEYIMLHSGNYSSYALPKAGGKMTGNIGYANGDYSDYDMIKWKTGDNNGAGVVIGGGGAAIIGGGESADVVYNGLALTGGSERMCICNDQQIDLFPGQQSGYTAAGLFSVAAGGAVTKCNGVNVPGVFVQSGTPTAKQTGDIWFKT